MNSIVKRIEEIWNEYDHLVFFSGAGVSTESGIPDFRSTNGLFHETYKHKPEVILSHTFFERHPDEFFRFYRDKMIYQQAEPNLTHQIIAELEKKGRSDGVITQNIDGLHQAAGSKNVLELHGSVYRNTCLRCQDRYGIEIINTTRGIPTCHCGGIIKPEVVLYEEYLDEELLRKAVKLISQARVLIILGTSLSVYPAASLIQYFKGDYLIVINRDPTPMDEKADLVINSSLYDVFSQIQLK